MSVILLSILALIHYVHAYLHCTLKKIHKHLNMINSDSVPLNWCFLLFCIQFKSSP